MQFVISGNSYDISRDEILDAVRGKTPEQRDGRYKFYVEIGGLKFPIKQVLHLVTGLSNGEFYPHDARRVLTKLGFKVNQFPSPRPHFHVKSVATSLDASNSIQHNRNTRGFAVSLETDEDGFYVVSCPALPGCHSQGRTREEALNNITEAIRGYLASMRKHGETLPNAEWEVVEVAI